MIPFKYIKIYTIIILLFTWVHPSFSRVPTEDVDNKGNCTAQFVFTIDSVNSLNYIFEDVSAGNVTYREWWINGFYQGSGPVLNVTFPYQGLYMVCLFIFDSVTYCNDYYCAKIFVTGNPVSCNADFVYEYDSINLNGIFFSDMSSGNIDIRVWDFGDGYFSYLKNPYHAYQSPGIYDVCLTIMDTLYHCIDTHCEQIVIDSAGPWCQALFDYVPDNQTPLQVNFINLSNGNIVYYSWNFGDGQFSNDPDPVHIYDQPGIYHVCLNISCQNNQGTTTNSTFCDSVVVENPFPPCTAGFSYSVDPQDPLRILFSNLSSGLIDYYHWDFGDGYSSSLKDPGHTYYLPGSYQVCLTIGNNHPVQSCHDSICIQITTGSPQFFTLAGQIFQGYFPCDHADIILYRISGNQFMAFDTTHIDTMGVYFYYQIPEGKYIVRALPENQSGNNMAYFPTYYGNKLFWETSSEIILHDHYYQADIQMIQHQNIGPGTGGVYGNIVYIDKSLPAVKVEILLLDSAYNPVGLDFSDSQGSFAFSELGFGKYFIYPEVPGLKTTPVPVLIDHQNPVVSGILIEISESGITSVESINRTVNSLIKEVYPVPAKNEINIITGVRGTGDMYYEIYTSSGVLAVKDRVMKYQESGRFSLYTGNLPDGVYFLKLYTEKSIGQVKFIVLR